MADVIFDLIHSSHLGGMAPPTLVGGGFGIAAVPVGMGAAGTYIIVNTITNNRYVGIANNIATRFNDRLPTVTEMGFATGEMNRIGVTWGATQCRNTPTFLVPVPPWVPAVPNPPAAFDTVIDGVNVKLERLLIRFVLTQLGGGGTVSNNMLAAAPYQNPTANAITVRLNWGTMGGIFAAGFHQAVWNVGLGNAW
jgi:hypothetical protein